MAYCQNCGAQLVEINRFCTNCGYSTSISITTADHAKTNIPANQDFSPKQYSEVIATALVTDEASRKIVILMARKDWMGALEILDTMNEKHESYFYTRGNILSNLNRQEEALRSYDEAVRLRPSYSKAWYRKGWTHVQFKQFRAAFEAFVECAKIEEGPRPIASMRVIDVTKPQEVTNSWKPAALISATLALIYGYHEGEEDDGTLETLKQLQVYDYNFLISLNAPELGIIPSGVPEFPDFLMVNSNKILDLIEPKTAVESYFK